MTELCVEDTAAVVDVFTAARWLGGLWNSSAKAVAVDELEWQCNTWGSGLGGGDWLDWGLFVLVVEVLGLDSWRNREGRNELVVSVPMVQFAQVVVLIERIGEDPECWPWLDVDEDGDDGRDRGLEAAAGVLGITVEEIMANVRLLDVLHVG